MTSGREGEQAVVNLLDLRKEYNSTSFRRIPPSFERWLAERIARAEDALARIWGLAMTDCGPEEYALFPQMLHEHEKHLLAAAATQSARADTAQAALDAMSQEMERMREQLAAKDAALRRIADPRGTAAHIMRQTALTALKGTK